MHTLAAGLLRVDKMDLAWLEVEVVVEAGIAVRSTPGHTPVASLVDTHIDLERLDVVRLGRVAGLIDAAIQGKQCRRFNKNKVLGFIVDAVEAELVSLDDLEEKVRASVTNALAQKAEEE